jgi:quercetin dioxygenase-like cupin family protein
MAARQDSTTSYAALLFALLLAGSSLIPPVAAAQGNAATGAVPTSGERLAITPDQIVWQPAKLLPPGAQMAVLEGDPSKPGFFTMRLKMPDGYLIPAHRHSQAERVTVIEGTLYLGEGDGSDKATAIALGPGSYSSMPPDTLHYGWMKGETILQLTSIGPWTVTYLKPADDPRNESK